MTQVDLSTCDDRAPAQLIREQLALRLISRQRLADEARISLSTLEKAMNGSRAFTLATLVRLEQVLGIPLRPAQTPAAAPPGIELGGYARAAVEFLEGDYLTLRPSFETPDALYAYRTEIFWAADRACLAFREAARQDADFTQQGLVSAPLASGQIYLHTNVQGQMRLAILSRPLRGGEMYGVLTTLIAGSGSQLTPAASPLALLPMQAAFALGVIAGDHPDHAAYRHHLSRASLGGYARVFV